MKERRGTIDLVEQAGEPARLLVTFPESDEPPIRIVVSDVALAALAVRAVQRIARKG